MRCMSIRAVGQTAQVRGRWAIIASRARACQLRAVSVLALAEDMVGLGRSMQVNAIVVGMGCRMERPKGMMGSVV